MNVKYNMLRDPFPVIVKNLIFLCDFPVHFRLLKMIDFLQKNYQKKFVLDELCDSVNLCRSACCRYFKRMMNMSISDYLNEYRLSQALFLLDNTDNSVTEIAVHSGFTSASYFISKFKEKTWLTPLEYKMRKKS